MTIQKTLSAAALALLLSTGIASAQSTTDDTTGVTTTATPGTPDTGAGGNASQNILILAASALVATGAGAYLATSGRKNALQ